LVNAAVLAKRLQSPTAGPPARLLVIYRRRANVLAFSPDGAWLAAGFQDGSARVWNTSSLDQEPKVLQSGARSASNGRQSAAVTALCFHPKPAGGPPEPWLFTGQADGTVRRWDLARQMTIDQAKRISREKIF
jgi:WD40 repeat protein